MGLDDRRERGEVYQPAEDSDLLASAAREEVSATDRVLDVGTGSGYVAHEVAKTGAWVVGVDRNPHACREAREHGVEAVRADLTAAFASDSFDLVTFNPPYLPTEPGNETDDWMGVALSGGADGRAVIEPFLSGVGRVLAPGGRVLLLVSSLTDIDVVRERATTAVFVSTALAEDSFPFEKLVVLELTPE